MIYFVRFYLMYPISCTGTQKRLTNPKTLIKVNIHISGSVKTYKISGQDIGRSRKMSKIVGF